MKTIILKVDNKGLHYNKAAYISWTDTNLPAGDFLLQSHGDIFWEVEMIDFNIAEECLHINVLNYESKKIENFEQQKPKRAIKKIILGTLSEQQFKAQLSFYKPESLNAIWTLEEEGAYEPIPLGEKLTAFEEPSPPSSTQSAAAKKEELVKKKINVILQDDLMETSFGLGVIKLCIFVEELGFFVDFVIENDVIIPEFDHIKSYFAKALKTPCINVRATIEVVGDQVTVLKARSLELENINDELILIVRSIAAEQVIGKPIVVAIDKSLFTGDELFDNFQEESIGDVFERSDDELLKDILALKNVRNVKQLHYLAGKLHEESIRLRFSLSPLFGFIFLVKGKKMNHFIWELLNSNATYLWSFDKDDGSIEKQYVEVEKILTTIREQGRQKYRQAYLNEGILFQLVTHEQVNSKLVNSFPKWKNRLLEKLV